MDATGYVGHIVQPESTTVPASLAAMLRQAGIRHQDLAGMMRVCPRTLRRWNWRTPGYVRSCLEQLIRVRQLEQEVERLQALLSDRSQAIDSHQD